MCLVFSLSLDWYPLRFSWLRNGSLLSVYSHGRFTAFFSCLFQGYLACLYLGNLEGEKQLCLQKCGFRSFHYCWKSEAEFFFMAFFECYFFVLWFSWLVEIPASLYGCHVIFFFFYCWCIFFRCLWLVTDFRCFITFSTHCTGWIT